MREMKYFAECVVDTVREPLLILDKNLRVVTAGLSFYSTFKVTKEETMGQLVFDLGNGQWDIPELRRLLLEILPERTTIEGYEVVHRFNIIGVLVKHFHRLIPDIERYKKASIFPGSLTQTGVQCEPLLSKNSFN